MPRDPSPPLGRDFDEGFTEELMAAVTINPAVHDGAVMLHRRGPGEPYRVRGWSYRLLAPSLTNDATGTNRGSAFNSCLATSAVSGIDAVYLIARGVITCFAAGKQVSCD
jgi:hypothetical protein